MIDNPSWQHFATHEESEFPELWRGVRGYWAPCLGPSGTQLHDVSGLNNWGTFNNMDPPTDWVVDSGRYALDFDGTNDHVLSSLSVPFSGNVELSISVWVYVPTGAPSNIGVCGFGNSLTALQAFGIWFASRVSNSFAVEFAGGNPAQTTGTVPRNQWNLITATKRPGAINATTGLIFNGVPQAVTGSSSTPNVTQTAMTIGVWTPTYNADYFQGRIAEVILHNRVITAAEAMQMYQIGRGGMLTPRRRRRAYFVQAFSPSWASGSNVVLQPSIGVS